MEETKSEVRLLEPGDVVYAISSYGSTIEKHSIDRVTQKQAFITRYGGRKFKREVSGEWLTEIGGGGGHSWNRTVWSLPSPRLDEKYRLQNMLWKVKKGLQQLVGLVEKMDTKTLEKWAVILSENKDISL